MVRASEFTGTLNSLPQEVQIATAGVVLSHFVTLRLRFGTRLSFATVYCTFQSWMLFLSSES
jgi:hypothetical protein